MTAGKRLGMDSRQQSNPYGIDKRNAGFTSHLTSFIGRQDEVQKVQALLTDPNCRLVSLVGPGGIGKSRLSLEIANEAETSFENGWHVIPLQGVTSVEQVVPAIANGVSCELYGRDDTLTQLKRYLAQKETLIVLDNFEHLLGAAHLIVELLDVAKGLKLLVTSREVLNLRAEWVWSVTGLQFPDQLDAEIAESDSAVHLFDRCARRLVPGFSLALEKAHIIRICQLVGGVPLAIELAASWLKSLTCEMIAAEIQRNLDFLSTNMRDMPDRHRSMRAVIDQSWALLTKQEQAVFKQLSVFRGGFTSAASDKISGASRGILGSLVDKSLISHSGGRYHLHELIRQYAQQHLNMEPDRAAQLLDTHAGYYVRFLADRLHNFRSTPTVLDDILAEMDNLLLMWEQVLAGKPFDWLAEAVYCFGGVLNYSVSRHEGIKRLAPAVEAYRAQGRVSDSIAVYAALLTTKSLCHASLMQVTEAIELLEECQSLVEQYDFHPQSYARSDPLIQLGIAHLYRGDFEKALAYGYRAAANGERYNDLPNTGIANQLLGMTYLALGQLDEAMQFGQTALTHAKQTGNLADSAYSCDHLGDTAMLLGDPAAAEGYYQDAYRYRQQINELMNLPLSMSLIGKAKLAQSQYVEAADWLAQSLAIYTSYNDTGNLIVPKSQLATCYAYMGEVERARDVFIEAIHAAEHSRVVPLSLLLIAHVGEFFIHLGDVDKGVELLSTATHHPMFNRGRDMVIDVEKWLLHIQKTMPVERYHAALQAGRESDLETTLRNLVTGLNTAIIKTVSVRRFGSEQHALYAKGIEPLSERELEVLKLISQGMTNQDIAEALTVTVGTVKAHTHNIYTKLGVKNRTQALKIAQDNQLI